MAQLSTIISSVLRDMIHAQHQANMYAVTMEDAYKGNGRLTRFPLPAIAVGDVEMELRYAVTDDSTQTEQYEVDYPQIAKLYKGVSSQLARILLSTALTAMQSAFGNVHEHEKEKELLADLGKKSGISKSFRAFLSRRILHAMQMGFTTLINADGTINAQLLTAYALEVGAENILSHEELQRLFEDDEDDTIRGGILDSMRTAVEQAMPKLLKDINVKRKRLLPSVEVTVNSQELSRLPDECVHTLHFKVSPRDIKFYTEDDK